MEINHRENRTGGMVQHVLTDKERGRTKTGRPEAGQVQYRHAFNTISIFLLEKAPCGGLLSLQHYQHPEEERVPVGSGLLSSAPYHLGSTIHPIHTHCSSSICLLLLLTTAQECLTAGVIKAATGECVFVQVFVCESRKDKTYPLPKGVCIYTINTPLHDTTTRVS